MSNQSIQLRNAISQSVSKLSEKFLLGHQKSQIKQKRGIVFIGNSRIGKSTISALISGIKMQIVQDECQFKIEPKEDKYRSNKNIIQHSFTSVTEFPNIYTTQINGQQYTVVDLPGFKDTQYEKELCNWHYIRSILSQLQKILFVMVIQVNNETKQIGEAEVEMMDRFAQAFPSTNSTIPKNNLITVVNFMQGIDTEKEEKEVKTKIRLQILSQLKLQNLQNFYENSLDLDRLFLLQKVKIKGNTQDYLKKGIQFQNQSLLSFIKNNVSKMQVTQQSSYKINLTRQKNKNSEVLRNSLIQFTGKMINSIGEKFELYKDLFALLLSRVRQKENVRCQSLDYKALQQYYKNQNINVYQSIDVHQKYKFESNFQYVEEIVCEIISHFYDITAKKEEIFHKRIEQVQQNSFKFISLIESLCKLLFDFDHSDKIQQISNAIKKSIHVDCYNIIYLFDSVEDFEYQFPDTPKVMFQDNCNHVLYEMYGDKFARVVNFKQQVRKYFDKLIRTRGTLPAKKVNLHNIQLLLKLKGACQIMYFDPQRHQTAILYFKLTHKKLHDSILLQNPQKLNQIIKNTFGFSFKNDELEQISKWKKTSEQWQFIKNKGYTQIIKHLRKSNYDKQKILKLYLKVDNFYQEAVELLRQIVEENDTQEYEKTNAFTLCMQSCQHMIENWEYHWALECCSLAQKIYQYQNKEKTIQARMKSIEVKNLINTKFDQNTIKAQLQQNPWINISDSEYNEIIKIAHDFKLQSQSQANHTAQMVQRGYLGQLNGNLRRQLSPRPKIEKKGALQKPVLNQKEKMGRK